MTILKFGVISLLVFGTIAANDVAPSNSELEAMYDKAYRAFDAANYTEALKQLDAIDARKPDLAASQNLRGVVYMRQGLYDKAEAALSEARGLDPKFWNARFNLAEIPFLKKDWAEARKRFQELLTSNAAELQGEAAQLIQYKILLTYLLEGNDTMVDSILAKFELSPDTPAVHYANAAISLQGQNIPDAKNWMSAAEKNFSPQLNKLFAESLYEIGWLQKQPGQQRPAVQLLSPEERASKTQVVAKTAFEQALQAYEQRDFDSAARLAAEAAWEFKHDNADKANDWITSARKIYPSASNAQYAAGFYDLGWLKNAMVVSSPTPTASVGAAAVASTQTESSVPAIEPSPIPGVEVKTEEGTQLTLAQTPSPSPKGSEAVVNPTLAEVIVSNAKATGTPARPEDIPVAPAATGISVESPSASATPAPSIALATAAPASTPAIAATPDVSVVTAPIVASTPEASSPSPAPAATIAAPAVAATPAPELAAGTPAQQPVIEPTASAAPVVATAMSATPATVLTPAKVAQFTPVPTFVERISAFTGQRPLLVWILGLSGFGLLVSVVVMEIRRRIGTTQIGHRPATVTGPPLHDGESAEETPALEVQKRFVGGPRQISVQLKASEPSRRRAVIPVANRAPETITAPPPELETATVNSRGESTYVDFEESSVRPVIERVPSNGEKEIATEAAAFASSVSDEPAVSYEQPVSDEPPVF